MKRFRKPKSVSTAVEPALAGALDRLVVKLCSLHTDFSGVRLVTDGTDAFALRVLSARTAVRSLDLQYYLWHSDVTGQFLAHEVLLAADRGVRVRLLLDDMDARSRDAVLMALDQHPQIEIRLFNPFATRTGMLRTARELLSRGSRLNHRMHNKAWIADARLAIVGGRNIGDEYFAASRHVNFVDLDVALIGRAVQDTESMFDAYWNSASAVPITNLRRTRRNKLSLDEVRRVSADSVRNAAAGPYAQALRPVSAIDELFTGERAMTWSQSVRLVADDPRKALKSAHVIAPGVLESVQEMFANACRELLLISPYFVPGPGGTAGLRRMAEQGAHIRVLTNSLAATDVAAVHSGYARYREPLLEAGIELYELKTAPEESEQERARRLRIGSSKASLHTKAIVIDSARLFVGSFNLDPRSATLNCEMGVWIEEPSLAAKLSALFDRATQPTHSFSVRLDSQCRLIWSEQVNGETVESHTEPDASWGRRLVTWLLQHLPIESQL
ncbi:MAG: phospholipase D family protein [Povalibacter sp.]